MTSGDRNKNCCDQQTAHRGSRNHAPPRRNRIAKCGLTSNVSDSASESMFFGTPFPAPSVQPQATTRKVETRAALSAAGECFEQFIPHHCAVFRTAAISAARLCRSLPGPNIQPSEPRALADREDSSVAAEVLGIAQSAKPGMIRTSRPCELSQNQHPDLTHQRILHRW